MTSRASIDGPVRFVAHRLRTFSLSCASGRVRAGSAGNEGAGVDPVRPDDPEREGALDALLWDQIGGFERRGRSVPFPHGDREVRLEVVPVSRRNGHSVQTGESHSGPLGRTKRLGTGHHEPSHGSRRRRRRIVRSVVPKEPKRHDIERAVCRNGLASLGEEPVRRAIGLGVQERQVRKGPCPDHHTRREAFHEGSGKPDTEVGDPKRWEVDESEAHWWEVTSRGVGREIARLSLGVALDPLWLQRPTSERYVLCALFRAAYGTAGEELRMPTSTGDNAGNFSDDEPSTARACRSVQEPRSCAKRRA